MKHQRIDAIHHFGLYYGNGDAAKGYAFMYEAIVDDGFDAQSSQSHQLVIDLLNRKTWDETTEYET